MVNLRHLVITSFTRSAAFNHFKKDRCYDDITVVTQACTGFNTAYLSLNRIKSTLVYNYN